MSETISAPDRIGLGIASMLVAVAAMTVMDAAAKWLGAGYSIAEVVFFVNLFALVPVLIAARSGGGLAVLRVRWRLGHLLRAAFGLGAQFTFFLGLRYLPLAEAIAILFAGPLFITALSVPVLGEKVGPRRWSAVLVGFAGVLVITRPGGDALRLEALLVLSAAFLYALAMLVTRRLARSDTTPAILFTNASLGILVSVLLLPFAWRTPSAEDLSIFVLMGLIGGIGRHFMTQAYRHAPAAVVAPFDYTGLIWGTLIGWLVWHEVPGAMVWLGTANLVASGLYIIHRETRVRPWTRRPGSPVAR